MERGSVSGNIRRRGRKTSWRWRKCLPGIAMAAVLVGLLFCARDIYAQLGELRTAMGGLETVPDTRQTDGTDTTELDKTYREGDEPEDSETVGGEYDNRGWSTSYVDSIGIVNVERPVRRTKMDVLLCLRELGENDDVIADISANSYLYPENMLTALANNPEMAEFVAGSLERDRDIVCELTDEEREQLFPLLLQWDPRWGYETYGSDSNVGLSGCGPTCLSMVLLYLTGNDQMTPDRVAAYSEKNGYYVEGTGTAWALLEDLPGAYGIAVSRIVISEDDMKKELDSGKILICAMRAGDFTVGGHFIVIYGYDKDGFWVNDPNCVARSRKIWSFEELESQIKCVWSYGKAAESGERVIYYYPKKML